MTPGSLTTLPDGGTPTLPDPARDRVILSCRDLDVFYGQAQVLFGVDLDVHKGEMLALLGVNGAGKSTLLRAICGLVKPARGSILLRGENITGLGADRIAARKIAMVPGGHGVFPTLTVAENLRVAGWMTRKDRTATREAHDGVLTIFPVLAERLHQEAGNLSGGEQQMLTLAQSFITRPDVLAIDELSLGLSPVVVGQLLNVVRAIHAQGVTVILVEQSLNVAFDLCARAVFMEKGEVRFDGRSDELRDRPDLLRSVFLSSGDPGGDGDTDGHAGSDGIPGSLTLAPLPLTGTASRHAAHTPARRAGRTEREERAERMQDGGADRPRPWQPGDPVRVPAIALDVRHVTVRFGGIRAVNDVSLTLHEGEILALIGGNGAGKTTLFDIISGFVTPDTGKVLLGGSNITRWNPARRATAGLGRSFQDALLFSSLTVRDTIAVALDRYVEVRDPISLGLGFPLGIGSERQARRRIEELIELTGTTSYADKFLSELSTGTRRMVDIACTLAHGPDVLLLDEPAAGIAQRETEALGPLLRQIRDETGTSLLIVEHDMPLIRAVADEVVVLEAGSVIASGTPHEVMEDPRVMASYLGGEITAIERSGAVHP